MRLRMTTEQMHVTHHSGGGWSDRKSKAEIKKPANVHCSRSPCAPSITACDHHLGPIGRGSTRTTLALVYGRKVTVLPRHRCWGVHVVNVGDPGPILEECVDSLSAWLPTECIEWQLPAIQSDRGLMRRHLIEGQWLPPQVQRHLVCSGDNH